jgi:hypothetical protein
MLRKPPPPPRQTGRPKFLAAVVVSFAFFWGVDSYSESSSRDADGKLLREKVSEARDIAAAAATGAPVPEPLLDHVASNVGLVAEAAKRQGNLLRGDCEKYVASMRDLLASVSKTSPHRASWAEETRTRLSGIQAATR